MGNLGEMNKVAEGHAPFVLSHRPKNNFWFVNEKLIIADKAAFPYAVHSVSCF